MTRRLLGVSLAAGLLLTLALPLAAEAGPTTDLGPAPSMQMAALFQATAQALGNAAHNATTAQQQSGLTMEAAVTMGVSTLYSLDAAAATGTARILD